MANNPSTLVNYTGRTNAPDASYPHGSARNDAVAGDRTGTPRVAAEINDIFGLQQALLAFAGITPNGVPDTVVASQYMQALAQLAASGASYEDATAAPDGTAYTLDPMPDQVTPAALRDGMRVAFIPATTNTDGSPAMTITGVAGTPVDLVTSDGGNIALGALTTGDVVSMWYDATLAKFILEEAGGVRGDGGGIYRVVSCELERQAASGGWTLADSATQRAVGVSSVVQTTTGIEINLAPGSQFVGSAVVDVDHNMASRGISAVATVVSGSQLKIQFLAKVVVNISGAAAHAPELFPSAVALYFPSSGELVVAHQYGTYSPADERPRAVVTVSPNGTSGSPANSMLMLTSVSQTQTVLQAMSPISGLVDTTPAVTTENLNTSVSWTGSNTLEISHLLAMSAHDICVVSDDPLFSVSVVSFTTTAIHVQFFDLVAGALYTGANPPAQVLYSRSSVVPSVMAAGLFANVVCGNSVVDPANIIDSGGDHVAGTYVVNLLGLIQE